MPEELPFVVTTTPVHPDATGQQAAELVAFINGSNGELSGSSSSTSLSELVASQGPLIAGPNAAVLAVLSQQQVLAPVPQIPAAAAAGSTAAFLQELPTAGQAGSSSSSWGGFTSCNSSSSSSVMQFVTAWLLQLTLPDQDRLLGVAEVWPLLSQLQQLIIVSSNWLPRELVHVLLRGGVAAVVCGTDAEQVSELEPAAIAEFFGVFYTEGLWQGLDIVQALQVAAAAVPAVGDSVYECCQLV